MVVGVVRVTIKKRAYAIFLVWFLLASSFTVVIPVKSGESLEGITNDYIEPLNGSTPIVNFIYSPTNPTTQDIIAFNDTSLDNDGTIVNWTWDFGDGSTSNTQHSTHRYADKGIYFVVLSIIDDNGFRNATSKQIYISNSPPVADFTVTTENLTVNFDASSSYDHDGYVLSYTWDFGDNSNGTGFVTTHSYPDIGKYTVTLIVVDNDNGTNVAHCTLEINATNKTENSPATQTPPIETDYLKTQNIKSNEWWNYDWGYRKKIGIINASKDYQLPITIYKENEHDDITNGTIDCENNCNENFSDIRFIDGDSGTELSYWIEKIDVSNQDHYARVWVKILGSDYIYLYYGNRSAKDNSNGYATFLFFDDFSSNTVNQYYHLSTSNTDWYIRPDSDQANRRIRWKSLLYDIKGLYAYWGGSVFYGACEKNSSELGDFVQLKMSYNHDVGANDAQPVIWFTTQNGAVGSSSPSGKPISKGNTYTYEFDILGGQRATAKIYTVGQNEIWAQTLTSNVPEILNYQFIEHYRVTNRCGDSEFIAWLSSMHQLQSRCVGINTNERWSQGYIENRFDWWFVANYSKLEPTWACDVAEENVALLPSILISSDSDFDAQHSVTGGNGTSNNPYILTGDTFYNVVIQDTTKYFKLYNFNIYSQILIENVAPHTATIENIVYDNGRELTSNGECILRIRNSDYPKIFNCTFINWTNAQTAAQAIVLDGTSDGSIIRGCNIYCGSRPNTYAMHLGAKGHHIVEDCIFRSTAVGIIVHVENSSISNCTFVDTFDEGLAISSARNVYITGCNFYNNGCSIEYDGFDYLPYSEIRNVVVKRCNLTTIDLGGGVRNCVIEDNYFGRRPTGILYSGFELVTNVKIIDNKFNTTGNAISLHSNKQFTNNTICSNQFVNGDHAFYFSGNKSFNNLIYNNYFSNKLTGGVYSEYGGGKASYQKWNISKTPGTNIVGGPYLGGNYWPDYYGKDTNGDGLGDTNVPHHSLDYLPLRNVSTPTSSVNPISPYWKKTSPLMLKVTATDMSKSGLKNITLYYYNSTNNNTWKGPWKFGSTNTTPWKNPSAIPWSFTFPNLTGYYRFYSVAYDNATNKETFTGNDTKCGYDNVAPTSSVNAIAAPYWKKTTPLAITATASDTGPSGLKNVTLYYYNSTNNATWKGPWKFGNTNTAPWITLIRWNFNFPNGTGYYRFYSVAYDNATNKETTTGNDTKCGYDNSVSNKPPNTPNTPYPANGTTGVSLTADLSWNGGDPDVSDTVKYDVYFGTTTPPTTKISANQSGTSYDPGTMGYNTKYYWKIVARDNHGAVTQGPIWYFTTLPKVKASLIYVDDNYDKSTHGWLVDHFNNIQMGIDNVSINGTVVVYAGEYEENIVISKQIHLIGESRNTTNITSAKTGEIITVAADGCVVKNFNIRNNRLSAGVKIVANFNTIVNNKISENYYGVWVESISRTNISNNIISENKIGVYLLDAENSTIINNEFMLNTFGGLSLESSYDAVIKGNVFQCNGITFSGPLRAWTTHTITGNTVNEKQIYYYRNAKGFVVPKDAGQVILANCTNVTIKGLTISQVDVGIQLGYSSAVNITGNTFTSNTQSAIQLYYADINTISDNNISENGIDLWGSSSNVIQDNVITEADLGLNLYDSSDNMIISNHITDNFFGVWLHNYCEENIFDENIIAENPHGGIWLMINCTTNVFTRNTIKDNGELSPMHTNVYIVIGSNKNIFYHNNFITASVNAFDTNDNSWDQGALVGGNYWSTYKGIDYDADGIGDTPYIIPGGRNQDYYPFINKNGWNQAPYAASNLYPENGAIDVPIDTTLTWSGGDPDGDTVIYDVYIGTTNPPPFVSSGRSIASYSPELAYNETYYWQIKTFDICGLSTLGPLWMFTIESGPPLANFIWSPQVPKKQAVVQFTDTSVEQGTHIVMWNWSFGDGEISKEQHPMHTYKNSGSYTVTLLITDKIGQINMVSKYLYVDILPTITYFTYTPGNPIAGDTIQFIDTSTFDPKNKITSWLWSFGDGTTSTQQNPNHRYTGSATFTVQFFVRDTVGWHSTTRQIFVKPNLPPNAQFSFSSSHPTPMEEVRFNDQSSDDDGLIVSWLWKFGDGQSSQSQNPTHHYSYNGSYKVTLTVTDNRGFTGTIITTIRVGNEPPVASFTHFPYDSKVDQVIYFFDESKDEDGIIISWYWDFGDGTTSTDQNPIHSYNTYQGAFKVSLRITDNNGQISTCYQYVDQYLDWPPHAKAGGPYSGRPFDNIVLNGSGSKDLDGTIVGYQWDFTDDGTYDTDWLSSPIVMHSYPGIGTYLVRLRVKDNYGLMDTSLAEVQISKNSLPSAEAGGPYSGKINASVTFDGSKSSDSDGNIIGYKWDFTNDGIYETGWLTSSKTTYSYDKAGIYNIKLEVKDSEGATATDTATVTISINIPPTAEGSGPYTGIINEPITFDGSKSRDPDGKIVGYRWDWTDDGIWDTVWLSSPMATHIYPEPSTYIVRLQVKDISNQLDDDTASVIISEPTNRQPVANAGGPYKTHILELVLFNAVKSFDPDGSIVGYRWDFTGDGVYDTEWLVSNTTTFTYSKTGIYTITLQVKDNDGAVGTNKTTVIISINVPPTAKASGPYTGVINEPITFDGSKSRDSDGKIVGCRWDFTNDGTYETEWLTTATKTYMYSSVGVYTVKIQVKDDDGATATNTAPVTILPNIAPTADAGGPYCGHVNTTIFFDGSESFDRDGTIVEYRWDFNNDGIYDTVWSREATINHCYSVAGIYTNVLEVKDNGGATNTNATQVMITLNRAPIANAGGLYTGVVNISIKFDGSRSTDSDGRIVGYEWDFTNDGVCDTNWIMTTVTHIYSSAGTYTAKLQVKDDDGATATDTSTVIVASNDPPVADAGGPYVAFVGQNVIFDGSGSSDTDGNITGYRWDFKNDGLYDTNWLDTSTTTFCYSMAGTYTVKIQVKDNHESTDTDTATVKITDSHLRGLWHLDEGSGTIAHDSSDLENHGEIVGAIWTESGKLKNSLIFRGSNDYVIVKDIKSSFDYFTVSIWAKFNDISNNMPLISRQDGSGVGRNILTLESNEISTYIGGAKIGTGFTPVVDEWHHYVLTYSNGLLKIYIDSNLKVTKNVKEEDATGAFILGADKNLVNFFNGNLDEIAIWDKALALYEIQNLYSIPNQPIFEKPVNQTLWVDPNIESLSCIVSEPYEFVEPTVQEITLNGTTYDRVEQEGSESYGGSGEPSLPARGAYILLPQGTDVSNIKIMTGEREVIGEGYYIEPVATPTRLDSNESSYPVPDDLIYNSNETYPGKFCTLVGTYDFRGYKILVLTLHSVQYVPTTGELFYYKDMIVTVQTKESEINNELFRGLATDKLAVEKFVDNPGLSEDYQTSSQDCKLSNNYDMVIITTNSLKNGFEPLKQKHDSDGLKTLIYTTEDIYRQYAGVDNAEKIHNFIIDAYTNMGIQYVIIGGDDDIIPARRLWVQAWPGSSDITNMPSDLYYSCLDGPFNNDGDKNWGEPNDGAGGGDVDLIADVYVGRACVGNAAEVENFVSKTISYLNTKDDEYLKEVLLVGEYLGFGGVADYAGNAMDELVDGSSNSGYTTVGFSSDEYNISKLYDSRSYSWQRSELINKINSNIHIVNHLGHANYQYNMKLFTSDLNSLTNDKYCFIYSQGCMAGGFDVSDCIAEYFTTKIAKGAFAGIWNARYGWGSYGTTDGPSQRFDRQFWDAVFKENLSTLGRANSDSKEDNLYRISGSCMRWCYYELNLFGDPSLDLIRREASKPENPNDSVGHMNVSFYWGNNTLIGIDENVGNNSIASVKIGPLNRYTNVSWYVVINDGFNIIKGPLWWFTVKAYDWDINSDGKVDDTDSELLVSHYGETGKSGWIREDIIRDGRIDIKDLTTFVKHYGESYILEFEKNEVSKTLTVTAVHLSNIKWSDLKITGTANTDYLNSKVKVGDKITGCSGNVTITYLPFDSVSWAWAFDEEMPPEQDKPNEIPSDQKDGCDINKDGVVDADDADLIAKHYGEIGKPGTINEDINNDGIVDLKDVNIIVEILSNENSSEKPPEDTSSKNYANNEVNNGGSLPGSLVTPKNDESQINNTENESKSNNKDVLVTNSNEIFADQNIYANATSVRSIELGENIVSLISIDHDTIPEYVFDPVKNTTMPITYVHGEVTNTQLESNNTIQITIHVQKANWIYIETKDLYPYMNITIKTTDDRTISSDMIWRENGSIYVLDDPDTEYRIIYHNKNSSAILYPSSQLGTPDNGIFFIQFIVILFSAIAATVPIFVIRRKKNKMWSEKIQQAQELKDEIDQFADEFKKRHDTYCSHTLGKEYQLLKMMKSDGTDVNADFVANKLDISINELESLVNNLVKEGLLQFTSEGEVEITDKGRRFI